MSNILISYINYVDLLTTLITASSSQPSGDLVVNNLKLPQMRNCHRSNSGVVNQVYNVDFISTANAPEIKVFGVFQPPDPGVYIPKGADYRGEFNGWMASTDTIRNELSAITPAAHDVYDSGTAAGGWAKGYGVSTKVLTAAVAARYWTCTLAAPSLSSVPGFLDIGRLWAGPAFIPSLNFDYGWSDTWVDGSQRTDVARSGGAFFDMMWKRRELVIALRGLNNQESKDTYKELQRIAGKSGQVLVIPEPGSIYDPTQAIIGRMKEVSPITQVNFALYEATFTVTQDL
jgi:hypothetical protein